MTEKNSKFALPAHNHRLLSELPEEEIVELLPDNSFDDTESILLFEELLFPSDEDLGQEESELFVKIVSLLAQVMPYGQAILLMAIFACSVEDRIRMTAL